MHSKKVRVVDRPRNSGDHACLHALEDRCPHAAQSTLRRCSPGTTRHGNVGSLPTSNLSRCVPQSLGSVVAARGFAVAKKFSLLSASLFAAGDGHFLPSVERRIASLQSAFVARLRPSSSSSLGAAPGNVARYSTCRS